MAHLGYLNKISLSSPTISGCQSDPESFPSRRHWATQRGNGYLVTSDGGPAVVRVTAGPVERAPEPGALVLCGIGLMAVGGGWPRRRKSRVGAYAE
jgi:hypothetical protein